MKKILFGICLSFLFFACYEDKGSYDYHFDDINQIEKVSFIPEAFQAIGGLTIEFQQPLSENKTERIEVKLEQSLNHSFEHLDFLWRIFRQKEGKTVVDTVRTKGYLDIEFLVGKEAQYSIVLEVKDQTTTLTKYTKLIVKTRPVFKNSLFLLHGSQSGSVKLGNVEIIGDKAHVRTDAFHTIYPHIETNPFSNGVGLGYSAYLDLYKIKNSHNLCVFNMDGTSGIYDPFGLKNKFHPGYVLPLDQENPFVYHSLVNTGDASNLTDYKCLISRDGRFYVARSFLCFYPPAYVDDPQTDYKVTAATITDNNYVFWDELHNRFLYLLKNDAYTWNELNARDVQMNNPVLNAYVDFSGLPSRLNPVGKQAVYAYIRYRENYREAHPLFLFKDKTEEKFYLYELTPTGSDKDDKKSVAKTRGADRGDEGGEQGGDNEPAFTITGKELKNFRPGKNLSTIMYNMWFTTNFLFYAEGGNVYRYNTEGGNRSTIYSAPEGYTISVMKFRSADSGSLVDDLGLYLSIGLNKGDEGAIAEIKLTTSADVDKTYPATFYNKDEQGVKFGNIRDVQFAHIYTYKTINTK